MRQHSRCGRPGTRLQWARLCSVCHRAFVLGQTLTRSGTPACFLGWLMGPSLWMLLLDVLLGESTLTDGCSSSADSMLWSQVQASLAVL